MKILPKADEKKTQLTFHSRPFEESELVEKDLLQIFPFGIQISPDGLRPVLLLKDEKGEHILPVPLNHLEAGVALSQNAKTITPNSPHKVTQLLFESLHIQIVRAVFVEIKGSFQFLRLIFKNHPSQSDFKIRAEEALSLCLYLSVPIYATADYMSRSRILTAEMEGINQGLLMNPQVLLRPHHYII